MNICSVCGTYHEDQCDLRVEISKLRAERDAMAAELKVKTREAEVAGDMLVGTTSMADREKRRADKMAAVVEWHAEFIRETRCDCPDVSYGPEDTCDRCDALAALDKLQTEETLLNE